MNKLSIQKIKNIEQVLNIWSSEGYILSNEDKLDLEKTALSGTATNQIKKILQQRNRKEKC